MRNQSVWTALHNPTLKLLSYERADAYHRLFPYIAKLTLPAGVIDFEHNIPREEIRLIGTKEMLAARDGLHPALVDLLVDAAREIHDEQPAGFASEAYTLRKHIALVRGAVKARTDPPVGSI